MTRRRPLTLTIGVVLVGIVVVLAVVSFFWTPYPPTAINAPARLAPMSWHHPFGADRYGHDVLSQIMQGARLTLYVGIVAVAIAGLVGIPLGALAALRGGWFDQLVGRVSDVAFAFPALLAAVMLAAAYGSSTTTAMIAIGIANTPVFVRITRAETLRVMHTDYVLAARTAGRSRPAILVRHVLPNIAASLIVQGTVLFAIAILAEAALSYLGLGTPAPTPSWGRMLNESKEFYGTHLYLAVWPGVAIAIAVLGFNLLGDGLRDRLDPRLPRAAAVVSLLDLHDLTVHAGTTVLVDAVTLSVGEGERVGIIGESGCGKSLTALSVMGLLTDGLTASGSITLGGTELVGLSERGHAAVRGVDAAMVFQEPMTALNPLMRVGAQVEESIRLHRGLGRAETRAAAIELLGHVELPDPAHVARSYPFQLSGGQRQRVMLAIALACRPRLLICDEPTTALDVTVQAKMLVLIDRLVAEFGTALLFITHDLAVMASVCDRVIVMYGGRVVESGPVEVVLAAPQHPYTVGLLAASAATARHDGATSGEPLPTIPGTVPPAGRFPSGCVFRNRCDRATEACTDRPALREAGPAHAVACFNPVGSA